MVRQTLNKSGKFEKAHIVIIKFGCNDIITTSDFSPSSQSSESTESGIDLPIDKF